MFYDCGNGYGIYMTTEEYFSIPDDEFVYIINTKCFSYYDPFYSKRTVRMESMYYDEDNDVVSPQSRLKIDDIINILDSYDNTNLFADFDFLTPIDDADLSEDE